MAISAGSSGGARGSNRSRLSTSKDRGFNAKESGSSDSTERGGSIVCPSELPIKILELGIIKREDSARHRFCYQFLN